MSDTLAGKGCGVKPGTDEILAAADAYILALRQIVYSGKNDVVTAAWLRVNDLGSKWTAVRSQFPESTQKDDRP